jgi:hypothetical protein
VYRTVHPTAEEYISFTSAHRTHAKTDHILGHKINLNNIERGFPEHHGIKLEVNTTIIEKPPI